jgi:hypothetical protein
MKSRIALLTPDEASLSAPVPMARRCGNCASHPNCPVRKPGKGKVDDIFMELIENDCPDFTPVLPVIVNNAGVVRALDHYASRIG